MHMNRKIRTAARSVIGLLLALTVLIGVAVSAPVQAEEYRASYIERVDGKLEVDYSKYLNEEVMFRLPDTIRQDEEISVIVTLDVVNLMDAYDAESRTMSFRQYALESDEAKGIRQDIADRKAELLSLMEENGISYQLGRDYSTLLSGFEPDSGLMIDAGML